MNENCELIEKTHHKQNEFCYTRPAYRASKKLTAVKTYTVAAESAHLFVYNVPKINLRKELKSLFSQYGHVSLITYMPDYKTELFTECYHILFDRIQSARIAKRLVDNKSFYGEILHVCYAPECETIKETRNKLQQRRTAILNFIKKSEKLPTRTSVLDKQEDFLSLTKSQLQKKRKIVDELNAPNYNKKMTFSAVNKN